MKTNPILDEIRQVRDQLYDDAGGDLRKLFEMVRQREAAAAKRGVVFIAPPSPPTVLREEPATYRSRKKPES